MATKAILGTVAMAAVLSAPSIAHAGTGCKSTWTKASGKIKTFFVPAGKLVCKKLNTKDEAAANKCIEDLEKFAADAERIKEEWNAGEDGSWKIGPRSLPLNRTQSGTVSTERQFVGSPVLNGKYTLEVNRTGGKAKNDMIIKVCFVDENGDDVDIKEIRLSEDGDHSETITVENVEGTIPLIWLNNEKWGTNGHQYTIRLTGEGEPDNVAQARATLAKSKPSGTPKPVAPKKVPK